MPYIFFGFLFLHLNIPNYRANIFRMKNLLFAVFLLTAIASNAQQAALADARNFINLRQYKKAIPITDAAVTSAAGKNDAEAWYLRGVAYLQQAGDSSVKAPDASSVSYASFMKALYLKKENSAEMNNVLHALAFQLFNDGVAAYSEDPAKAYDAFSKVTSIYTFGDGMRFKKDAVFTQYYELAKANAAYSAFLAKKDKEAAALFRELMGDGKKDSAIYATAIELYERDGLTDQLLQTIVIARKDFPDSRLFRNREINFYLQSGQQDSLLTKLEAAHAADPQDPELAFNLGNAYIKRAFPKDAAGKYLPAPPDFKDIFTKTENAYLDAMKLQPLSSDYNYNAGVLYYEAAASLNTQMNALGTSDGEEKKYQQLLIERNRMFSKATPYFEKIAAGDPQKMSAAEKETYRNALTGLNSVYTSTAQPDKAAAAKDKLNHIQN